MNIFAFICSFFWMCRSKIVYFRTSTHPATKICISMPFFVAYLKLLMCLPILYLSVLIYVDMNFFQCNNVRYIYLAYRFVSSFFSSVNLSAEQE